MTRLRARSPTTGGSSARPSWSAASAPTSPGASRRAFHFDLSYNYYPREFERPGPEVRIYRLTTARRSYGPLPRRRPAEEASREASRRRGDHARAGGASLRRWRSGCACGRSTTGCRCVQRRRGAPLRARGRATSSRGSFNPGYFENPPALTYLLHVVFRLCSEGFPFGAERLRGAPSSTIPRPRYLTARVVVALDRHRRRGARLLGRARASTTGAWASWPRR